jgi:hypothetical protein
LNTGKWSTLEQAIKNCLKLHKSYSENELQEGYFATLRMAFHYEDKRYPERPSSFSFEFKVERVKKDYEDMPELDEDGKPVIAESFFYRSCLVKNPNDFDTSVDFANINELCKLYDKSDEKSVEDKSSFLEKVEEICKLYLSGEENSTPQPIL